MRMTRAIPIHPTFHRQAAGALRSTTSPHTPLPGETKLMSTRRPTFDHLLPAPGQRANADPGLPFAHLLGFPATPVNCEEGVPFMHLLDPAPGTTTPITSPTAAAIVAVGEHARRAQEGGK
jgi:hypothetical protein